MDRGRFLGFPKESPELEIYTLEARSRRKMVVPSTESTWTCPRTGTRLAPGAIRNWAPIKTKTEIMALLDNLPCLGQTALSTVARSRVGNGELAALDV
jgi:hypothetical protein